MTENEREGFFEEMVRLGNAYSKSLPVGAIDLWFRVLRDYTLAEVLGGLDAHMRDSDVGSFFPKPADVIRQLQGTSQTRGMAAWEEALREVRRVGSHLSPEIPDPLTRAAIDRMGGWPAFCAMTEDWTDERGTFHTGNKDFRRRQFLELYQSFCQRAPDRIPERLFGTCETLNAASQWCNDPRALVSGKPIRSPESLGAADAPKALPAPTAPTVAIRNVGDLSAAIRRRVKALRSGQEAVVQDVEGQRSLAKHRLADWFRAHPELTANGIPAGPSSAIPNAPKETVP